MQGLDMSLDSLVTKAPRRGKGGRQDRAAAAAPYSKMRSDGGGSRECHICGEQGHLARNCPDNAASAEVECYSCSGFGHISRDCPQGRRDTRAPRRERSNGGSGGGYMHDDRTGGGQDDVECYTCGGMGHISRDCPDGEPRGDTRGARNADVECYDCGGFGHRARDCPAGGGRKGGGKGRKGGKGKGGKGKGKDRKPTNANDLEDDLDAYFGREGGKEERAAIQAVKSKENLDAGLDDYFGRKDEPAAEPAAEATE
eukprot:TRINITY_DN18977_c0_g2_i1.p1 TRINITY_DN18977_c0_g2~~TRINITY_DN18977_c0_g2_i1.p1  ORF type:complete len:256 (+),score=57.64 TRINITY_DN18977_c0_g2_i1:1-768(+)